MKLGARSFLAINFAIMRKRFDPAQFSRSSDDAYSPQTTEAVEIAEETRLHVRGGLQAESLTLLNFAITTDVQSHKFPPFWRK